jgi:hypothetical protein
VPSRFVLAIKEKDGEEVLKAIFVLGGHRDRDKKKLVPSSITLKQSFIGLLLATAAIKRFEVISADVIQAYLQSASELKRKVFVKANCFDLKPDELLQIMKPLYGLADSGDYLAQTFVRHHLMDLRMTQATGDFSLFFKRARGALIGISGCYVDDVIRAGTPEFLASATRNTEAVFDTKAPAKGNFEFLGLRTSEANGVRTLSQAEYVSRLKLLPAMADYSAHRSLRSQLAWVTHTRPDIACAVSQAAQVTRETFDSRSISDLNGIIKYLRQTSEVSLKFAPLELSSLRMCVYTDASQANNEDLSSQVGYIIVLTDNTNRASIVHCQSHKPQSLTRSSMAGETLAFADGFDNAFLLRHELESMLGQPVPLIMFTESQALFNVVTRNKTTTERRLMVDVAAARQAYHSMIISNIGLIKPCYNPADELTKVGCVLPPGSI